MCNLQGGASWRQWSLFSDDSIKYQNVCHHCHNNLQAAADTSLSANADHDTNAQCVADTLLSPKDNCLVESAPAAVALKVMERNQVKKCGA
jgi:hypothetical protein